MPTEDVKFTFPKSARLKSSLLIKDIVRQRDAVFSFPIKCFYSMERTEGREALKVSFLVSKKRFHHAVDRNRVKRLFREAYRLHNHELKLPENLTMNLCWMMVAPQLPSFQQVEIAAQQIFKELQSKVNTPS